MTDISALAKRQNPDGGWPYRNGSSCTEPTALGLLAFAAAGELNSQAALRGIEWLRRSQRPDGGWSPRLNVERSTWVTALALLVPGDGLQAGREKALRWLMGSSGRESSWVERSRSMLAQGQVKYPAGAGFPWYAETTAWVTPTSFGILALEKSSLWSHTPQIQERTASARDYLLSHTC